MIRIHLSTETWIEISLNNPSSFLQIGHFQYTNACIRFVIYGLALSASLTSPPHTESHIACDDRRASTNAVSQYNAPALVTFVYRQTLSSVNIHFTNPLTLSSEHQSARMSKIINDGLTRSGTECFIAVPIWQQWVSKS